jgi:Glycosyl transferases group 1
VKAVYIGNVGPGSVRHSTENHIKTALEANGVEVIPIHEQSYDWRPVAIPPNTDFVIWTHTHSFAPPRTHDRQFKFLRSMRLRGTPVVSYHLDRYWNLYRETQIWGPDKEPFFDTDVMCSADGGDPGRWAGVGVNHAWFPPAVSRPECEPGTYRAELASDIAFVGSWDGAYHAESPHRQDLVHWLRATYGDRCAFWPKRGKPAIRNEELRDLYASVKVLVGDSCFVGTPHNNRYWSDRIPETLGRGGFLIHPDVPGLDEHYTPGKHLWTWQAGDWPGLRAAIDGALDDDTSRTEVAAAGRAHVLEHHTYEHRMATMLDMLCDSGIISA